MLLFSCGFAPGRSPAIWSAKDSVQVASTIRVMVVEDFQSFRRFVCAKLGQKPEVGVICEVSDGLEAVQKAEELKPDLILLTSACQH